MVSVWSYGAIKPRSSIEIASADKHNEKLRICEDMSKLKNAIRVQLII